MLKNFKFTYKTQKLINNSMIVLGFMMMFCSGIVVTKAYDLTQTTYVTLRVMEYHGSLDDGTVIDGNTPMDVVAVRDDGYTVPIQGWSVDEPVTLSAGEKTTIHLSATVHGKKIFGTISLIAKEKPAEPEPEPEPEEVPEPDPVVPEEPQPEPAAEPESPEPVAQVIETPAPVVEQPQIYVQQTTPVVETPKPMFEDPMVYIIPESGYFYGAPPKPLDSPVGAPVYILRSQAIAWGYTADPNYPWDMY